MGGLCICRKEPCDFGLNELNSLDEVLGGYYDVEFSELTIPFFEQAKTGKFTIILSDVTIAELQKAPDFVRDLPGTIPANFMEVVTITDEQFALLTSIFKRVF